MNFIKLTYILAVFIAATAYAKGPGTDGGGNSVNHKLVEDYAVNLSEVKGHEIFEQKLAVVEKALPELGKALRIRLESMTFYVIPRKIKELPEEKTGLRFRSDQVAYHAGDEVFIDSSILKKFSNMTAAKLCLHEAFMSLTEGKFSANTRKIVARIFDPKMNPRELQRTLVQANFGAYLTKEQKESLSRNADRLYLRSMASSLEAGIRACNDEKGIIEIRLAVNPVSTDFAMTGHFQSPFEPSWPAQHGAVRKGWTTTWNLPNSRERNILDYCSINPQEFPQEICGELSRAFGYDENSSSVREPQLRKHAAEASAAAVNELSVATRMKIISDLSMEPAYLNVLGIEARDQHAFMLDPQSVEFPQPRDAITNQLARINRKIKTNMATFPSMDEAAERKLYCDSLVVLKSRVEKMRGGRRENIAKRLDEGGEYDAGAATAK